MPSQTAPAPSLDHLILLVPPSYLTFPPSWLTKHFNLLPGGTHADGKTANTLIVLSSGVYIEIIAFVDDSKVGREGHWWGKKQYGWIDWALTSQDVQDTARLINSPTQDQADKESTKEHGESEPRSEFLYNKPQHGGRTKPDGTRIEWEVTFPSTVGPSLDEQDSTAVERGTLPFWCHDVTPRENRVSTSKEATTHPSGATGIHSIRLATRKSALARLAKAYEVVFGVSAKVVGEEYRFQFAQPFDGEVVEVTLYSGLPEGDGSQTSGQWSAIITSVTIRVEEKSDQLEDVVEQIGHGESSVTISFSSA